MVNCKFLLFIRVYFFVVYRDAAQVTHDTPQLIAHITIGLAAMQLLDLRLTHIRVGFVVDNRDHLITTLEVNLLQPVLQLSPALLAVADAEETIAQAEAL